MHKTPLGLNSSQLNIVVEILRSRLSNKESYSVSFFGSRAKGQFRKYSDLDLWIESDPTLTRFEIAEIYESFEESDLSIKVDIVTPESCLPEYRPSILSEKILWLTQPGSLEIRKKP